MKGSPVLQLFEKKFGFCQEVFFARAPGRVNLIGEHTDYNEGYVLPVAIDRFTEVALRPRRDPQVIVYSSTFDEFFRGRLPFLYSSPRKKWHDYIVGILREFLRLRGLEQGFEAAIWSNVPIEAGLSSSAALEVAFATGLSRLYSIKLDDIALVKLCQRAERDFVGVPCGIMDQYTAYFAQAGSALFIDTRYLEHQYVPMALEAMTLLVIDSNVRRALIGSGYIDRQWECQEAVRWLAQRLPNQDIKALRDVAEDVLTEVRREMPDTLYRRALHVVKENARVLAMVEALKQRRWEEVGRLLYASHESLRDLFEVSLPELDFLVEWGMEHGALGARLVGGGFGGITLHLVPKSVSVAYSQEIHAAYATRFGKNALILEITSADGAKLCQEGGRADDPVRKA